MPGLVQRFYSPIHPGSLEADFIGGVKSLVDDPTDHGASITLSLRLVNFMPLTGTSQCFPRSPPNTVWDPTHDVPGLRQQGDSPSHASKWDLNVIHPGNLETNPIGGMQALVMDCSSPKPAHKSNHPHGCTVLCARALGVPEALVLALQFNHVHVAEHHILPNPVTTTTPKDSPIKYIQSSAYITPGVHGQLPSTLCSTLSSLHMASMLLVCIRVLFSAHDPLTLGLTGLIVAHASLDSLFPNLLIVVHRSCL
jgi:hypothetical protein